MKSLCALPPRSGHLVLFNVTRLPYPSLLYFVELDSFYRFTRDKKKYGTSGVAREAQNHPPSRVPLFAKLTTGLSTEIPPRSGTLHVAMLS